jgi:hypothetical protein
MTEPDAMEQMGWAGPPKDVPGECNARLHIGDDYGDNRATMRCGLTPGHVGAHREEFERRKKPVVVTWFGCCREEERQFEEATDAQEK